MWYNVGRGWKRLDSSEELCDQPRLVLDLHSTDHVGCLGHEIFLTKEKILVCAVSAAEDAFMGDADS